LSTYWTLPHASSCQSITKSAYWRCTAIPHTSSIGLNIAESVRIGGVTANNALSFAAIDIAKHCYVALEHTQSHIPVCEASIA
jgi:hypothetical protein